MIINHSQLEQEIILKLHILYAVMNDIKVLHESIDELERSEIKDFYQLVVKPTLQEFKIISEELKKLLEQKFQYESEMNMPISLGLRRFYRRLSDSKFK